MAEKFSYKLNQFEGPLDLLLYLISKNKLNIMEISLSQLLDQYMEKIREMQSENPDIASEFLEIAAKLVYLKTASLLPKDEEAEKIEAELTGRLLEYQECKRIAALLQEKAQFDRYSRAPMPMKADETYALTHDAEVLKAAFYNAVGRGGRKLPPPAEAFRAIVAHPIVSVETGVFHVLRLLRKGTQNIRSLFTLGQSRSQSVATFLAVLELIRFGRVRLENNGQMELLEGKFEHGTEEISSGH